MAGLEVINLDFTESCIIFPRNITAYSNGEKKLMLYPDPYLEPFDGGTKYFQSKSDYLSINVSLIKITAKVVSVIFFLSYSTVK